MTEAFPRTRIQAMAPVLASAISFVDGADGGRLLYRGYPVAELVEGARYEQVAWLLWTGQRATAAEQAEVLEGIERGAEMAAGVAATLPDATTAVTPYAHLLVGLALLPLFEQELAAGAAAAGPLPAALLLGAVALLAATVGGSERANVDAATVAERFRGGLAAGFLALARGDVPLAAEVGALEQVLILFAEHELNASTFAARIAASTRAPLVMCVSAALGTLSGPLSGGIERQVRLLLAEAAEHGVERTVERYEREGRPLPGFGHAVYRQGDPRAVVMRRLAETLATAGEAQQLYRLTREIEAVAEWRRLPRANVDSVRGDRLPRAAAAGCCHVTGVRDRADGRLVCAYL